MGMNQLSRHLPLSYGAADAGYLVWINLVSGEIKCPLSLTLALRR